MKTSPAFDMRIVPANDRELPALPAASAPQAPMMSLPAELLQLLNDGPPMYVASLDGRLLYASPAYRNLIDLHDGPCGALRPGTFALAEVICDITASGKPITREDVVETGDKTEFYSSQHFPIHDADGTLVAVGGVYQNATREAQAWLETLAARERFQDISRLVSDWIWETDERFDFTFVSPRIMEVVKLHPRHLVGTNLFALGTFKPSPEHASAKLPSPDTRSPFRDALFEIVTEDGKPRLFLVSGLPVFEDKTGAFKGFRGNARDITTEMEAKRSAELSQRRLAAAIENVSEGFAMRNGYGQVALLNSRFQDIFARISGSLKLGTDFAEVLTAARDANLVHEDSLAALDAWISSAHAGPEALLQPFELHLADGRWIKVSESRSARRGIVTIVSDITPMKQREEALIAAKQVAEEANRFKGEFLANMSHELRTPLNAIIGFSEIMRSETFGPLGNERYTDYMKDILDSSRHLLGIINDILDISKAEAGKLQLNEEPVDFCQEVRNVVRLFARQAAEVGLTLEARLPDILPPVWADARKVKQILLNLVSNAIKFTLPNGRVTISLRIEDGSGDLLLVVADEGIGIDSKDVDKVFSAFGQVESSLNRRYEGTGLGLPLSVALVEMHGGTLNLESTVGVGTTVTVRLPSDRLRQNKRQGNPT